MLFINQIPAELRNPEIRFKRKSVCYIAPTQSIEMIVVYVFELNRHSHTYLQVHLDPKGLVLIEIN